MVEFDAYGPEKILQVYNPKVGMRGFVVLDNLSLGPAMGGIHHELGSTGFGVAHAAFVALKYRKKDVRKISFAVEGFGNVGTFAAKFLTEAGATLKAVSDSKGCIYIEKGMNYEKLMKVKEETGSVINYNGQKNTCVNIVKSPVDVLITAAVPDVIKI